MLLAFLLCCLSAPTLDSVSPNDVVGPEVISIKTTGIHGLLEVRLRQGARVIPLGAGHPESEGVYTVTLPVDRPPSGSYDLEATYRGSTLTLHPGIRVLSAPEIVPCAHTFQSNTHVSIADATVTIDRYFPGGRKEQLVYALGQIESVRYLEMGDTPCSAVYLTMKDGQAVLFEDGTHSLRQRAEAVAQFMKWPLQVVAEAR